MWVFYLVVLYGVLLFFGLVDLFDVCYFEVLVVLVVEIEFVFVLDYLCWLSFGGYIGYDLWLLFFIEEVFLYVVEWVSWV